jgi:predicted HicB family RNase H-like nuclease
MENKLKYKGFVGSANFSNEDHVFCGKVKGINDLMTFEGTTVDELEEAFKYIVEEHIQDCDRQENLCETPCYSSSPL